MAVITPPAYLQSGSHSAQGDRQVVSALAGQDIETFVNGVSATGVGHGLVRSGHLAVSEKSGTPNMSVDVAKGIALVTGSSSLAQGVYVFANDATVNLAIATADATNPRYDLVIAQIRENTEDSGGSNDARLAVVTGTPAASPADPAVPAGCLVLARVTVAALASSIVNANITSLAGLARGSNWNQAWGTVGYAQITSDSVSVTALTAITGLSLPFTAVAGRRYRVTAQGEVFQSVAGDTYSFNIDNTSIGLARNFGTNGTTVAKTQQVQYVSNGSLTGALTWRVSLERVGGSGNITIGAAATRPAFIHLEDVGPL